ncbi:RNA polymerase sigma factor [Flavihumibacter fluvii]|uniref:RNA polymerase sigma factor n=1 Tax=Flavihumibacter fluvii TaxID=2838157 RepID=UPI001EFAD1AB|nr:sigma-70 family RNA polymerase sigma factor [Flavihumibacter fluvii]ULQ53122.1 sigma-70 family RNA polymerase sigma factor [Flavihumibacter fluvii]
MPVHILEFLKTISGSSASDQELADSYRSSGNLHVLGQLYSRYMDLVYGLTLKYLEDPEAAKDAVMQIFELLVLKLQQHEIIYFKSWLYTVAKNYCLMQLRSGKLRKTIELPAELMQSDDNGHLNGSFHKEAQLELLEKCLQQLTGEQQEAVSLFYLEQKSYNEIVAKTGMEWTKVRSLIQNGRRNLKICMDKHQ